MFRQIMCSTLLCPELSSASSFSSTCVYSGHLPTSSTYGSPERQERKNSSDSLKKKKSLIKTNFSPDFYVTLFINENRWFDFVRIIFIIKNKSGEKKVFLDRISKFLKITFFCEAEIISFNISSCFKHSLKPSCGRKEYYNNRKTFSFT